MRSESVKLALYDIRDNILLASEFVEGLTAQEFNESRLHVYAVTRALEIISEASRRLPDDLRDRHSQLPWRSIRDVGNFYRHQYDNVAASYVWETVTVHLLPPLAAVVAEIKASEGEI
ncbi:HepT-like ribonuclease domain-containing protein [Bradyrhizobium sp. AZCC 1693]|uniref:HepT-like ribonuclease domain-containing protein n=1 Tax=Bradyrhizobium sp. AZCC 1693 TaxID=3117029 RepID=UPI002FF0A05A